MGNPQSTAKIAGHPLHPMLVTIPIGCFVGTLLTDIVYWRTAEMMWANFSAWLVTVGVVVGILAAISGLIDFLLGRKIREQPTAWLHMAGNVVARFRRRAWQLGSRSLQRLQGRFRAV